MQASLGSHTEHDGGCSLQSYRFCRPFDVVLSSLAPVGYDQVLLLSVLCLYMPCLALFLVFAGVLALRLFALEVVSSWLVFVCPDLCLVERNPCHTDTVDFLF
jgi:hypothetical protein